MKVFIINLKSRTDKWQQMQKQLDQRFIKYERFDAVNGKELTNVDLSIRAESVLKLKKKKSQLDIDCWGHVGSYLSHYALWHRCLKEVEPIVILEDDVILHSNFTLDLPNVDFLSLGQEKIQINKKQEFKTWTNGGHVYVGAWAYMLTPKTAAEFIKYAFPIDMAIDFYMQAILAKANIPFQILTMVKPNPSFKSDLQHYPLESDNTFLYIILILLVGNFLYQMLK